MLNGTKINDYKQIVNGFNNFFTDIGPNLSDTIKCDSNNTFSSYLKKKITFSFEFKTVTVKDTLDTIKLIKPKTSCGHDNISTKLLKHMSLIIAPALTLIVNQSLSTGIFPDRLKIAKVIPLFKKGNPHVFDNYRPISLLPAVPKVFEKIVFKQLYKYLVSNKLIYESQYGFRDEHSTELAGLELCDRISEYIDKNKIPITIYLDLSKAFDTLDHNILLRKLKYYGVSGPAFNWFHSYLSNRHQYSEMNGCISDMRKITTGVPQGSILGPLLFIIYMNDIYHASKKFHSILYADDTSLLDTLCSFNTVMDKSYNKTLIADNINTELQEISTWLAVNKLSLNVQKTKFMIFHNRQRDISTLVPELKINGSPIERVAEFNFLGLTLDEHMSWAAHINKISNKLSRTIGIISRLKNTLDTHILKLIYNALITPHLQYAVLCWGYKSNRIFKLQKRAIRLITHSKYNAHTEPLFKMLNLLKVQDLYKWCCLKFSYKLSNGCLPQYFIVNFFK